MEKVISIKELRIVLEDLTDAVDGEMQYKLETGGDIRASIGKLATLNELSDWVDDLLLDEMEEL